MPAPRVALADAFAAFARAHPDQAVDVRRFTTLLADADAFVRARLAGHFTGSAFVLSADGRRVLLMHHAKLGRWLQPGGHADGDEDLAAVALREAEEETGLEGLKPEPMPWPGGILDLDAHEIPARGAEPAHWHHDVRYALRATPGREAFAANAESLGLAWRPVAEVAADATLDPSLRRMAARWLGLHR
jgi:8-oxo-dGTP pyrophosphatase MutT (NUDIX family)